MGNSLSRPYRIPVFVAYLQAPSRPVCEATCFMHAIYIGSCLNILSTPSSKEVWELQRKCYESLPPEQQNAQRTRILATKAMSLYAIR